MFGLRTDGNFVMKIAQYILFLIILMLIVKLPFVCFVFSDYKKVTPYKYKFIPSKSSEQDLIFA